MGSWVQTLCLVPDYVAGRTAVKIDHPTAAGEGQQAEEFLLRHMVQRYWQVRTS